MKNTKVTVELDPNSFERLTTLSDETGITKTYLVRRAVRLSMDGLEKEFESHRIIAKPTRQRKCPGKGL